MDWTPPSAIRFLFDAPRGAPDRLTARWLFLRALGGIYFSAFFSLIFQIRGLIGPNGILPADNYLRAVAQSLGGWQRVWYAPTLLWWSSGPIALNALCWAGMLASLLLLLNIWPRGMLTICFVCFLSFVSAAQDFSSYQSDGMLLAAGFVSFFFAPPGMRPGLGRTHPASRASLFLLQWEWFRIYFESGVVKLLSGDQEWRHFTAMDEYYQNGPLPTWIGWYGQLLPHWFHAATVGATLALELGVVWMLFLPRRWRIACFFIVTPWQIFVILTANYAFLNYLVLAMGVLLLDDRFVLSILPERWKRITTAFESNATPVKEPGGWGGSGYSFPPLGITWLSVPFDPKYCHSRSRPVVAVRTDEIR
jgi:lipase maturation factor 1